MRPPLLLAAAAAVIVSAPAAAQRARTTASPYIELDQVAVADLNSGDVLTYAQVAAGLDADVRTARAEGQLSFRYERRIPEGERIGDSDVFTGLGRASYRVARVLSLEAGGVATRTRVDIRGADPLLTNTARASNVTQVYSIYAGPTFATQAGPVNLGAAYRFGYTRADTPYSTGIIPGARQDYFSDSIGHSVSASAGLAPGRGLPVGITLSGGYDRESAGQLDQRYEDVFGRGDVLFPVSPTLALTAGAGYQKIVVSQKDAVLNANGTAAVDRNGRFVTDDASPRRIAYRTDGLIYDAGVVWRPSPRTSLVATVAHQYDSTAFTGAFGWQIDRSLAFTVDAYDGIETFGHQLRQGLQQLPTGFLNQADSFGQQFNGCIFASPGQTGQAAGAGGCLSDVFQSITTASYRARGIDAVLSARRGRNSLGVGAGYANRHLFAPSVANGLTILGLDNDSWYVQGFYSRRLDGRSQFDANLFGNWFESHQAGASTVFGAGGTAAYTRSFGRLGATAQVGVYTYDQQNYDEQWNAQALLGARYHF